LIPWNEYTIEKPYGGLTGNQKPKGKKIVGFVYAYVKKAKK